MNDLSRNLIAAREAADAASRLLDDPIFQQVMEALQARYIERWEASEPSAEATRTEAYWMQRALRLIKRDIKSMVGNEEALKWNHRTALRKLGN